MPDRDLVVIGASAGGVEALQQVVAALPPDFPATVLIVQHLLPSSQSYLPEILGRAAKLRVAHPKDGERLQRGVIFVAPPDHHMVVEDAHVHLNRGPVENRHRPSVNTLFRSAALAAGPRVVGVILTGNLDDGAAGLWEIKRHNGVTIVQDPTEAQFPDMPRNAAALVEIDYLAPVREIGAVLTRLAGSGLDGPPKPLHREDMERSHTNLTCPDCRGPLDELRRGRLREFRCRVGHTYTAESLLAGLLEVQEQALWAAAVALEETAQVAAEISSSSPDPRQREAMEEQIRRTLEQAREVRRIVTGNPDREATRPT